MCKLNETDIVMVFMAMVDSGEFDDVVENETDERTESKTATFSDEGVLTGDEGFVLKVGKQEFQITVVRSK